MKKFNIVLVSILSATLILTACFCMMSFKKVVFGKDEFKIYIADKIIDVPEISQYPVLPTGCESVSATMVLNYYGVDISPEDFASSWLECDSVYTEYDVMYGPNPNQSFVGDPFSEYSFGCYAPVIKKAVNNNSLSCKAQMITDKTLEELCSEFIDNDIPLLIWATMNMDEPQIGQSWYLDDGSCYTWTSGEHCLVLVGYNDDYYFFNDPMVGRTVAYEKTVSQQRFEAMGSQALHIAPNQC